MSVINQMLRDLDERQASEQERSGLPPRLRSLPPAIARRREAWRMLVIGVIIGAVLSALSAVLIVSLTRPDDIPEPQSALPVQPPPPHLALDLAKLEVPGKLPNPEPPQMEYALAPASRPAPVPAHATSPTPRLTHPAAPAPVPLAAPTITALPAPRESLPRQTIEDAGHIDRRNRGDQMHEQAEAEYRKGMQAVRRGDPQAALLPFHKALELDPAMAQARQALLSVLVSQRDFVSAKQVASQGLELDPRQSGWAAILARLQFEQGDPAGAVITLENFAVHAGADADYQGLFAFLLQKQQRPAEAAQRFETALALRPKEGRWWFGLATAHEALGRTEEAREAYARARASGNLPPEMLMLAEEKLR